MVQVNNSSTSVEQFVWQTVVEKYYIIWKNLPDSDPESLGQL